MGDCLKDSAQVYPLYVYVDMLFHQIVFLSLGILTLNDLLSIDKCLTNGILNLVGIFIDNMVMRSSRMASD